METEARRISFDSRLENGLFRIYESNPTFVRRNFTEHHHTAIEISLVVKGKGMYRIHGEDVEISEGDIFIFGTNEVHWIYEISEPMQLLNIQCEPRYIWSPQSGGFDNSLLDPFFNRADMQKRLSAADPLAPQITEIIKKIRLELSEMKSGHEIMARSYLFEILVLLSRKYSKAIPAQSIKVGRLNDMEAAFRFIDENITAPISLDEIASSANMSRTYFCTVFKKLNGLSPWEYIGLKRIQMARGLLEKTSKSILDISLECGFNNISHFNRAFKSATGRKPSEYRSKLV